MAAIQPTIMIGPATCRELLTWTDGIPAEKCRLSRPRMAAKTLKVMSTRSMPNATVGM